MELRIAVSKIDRHQATMSGDTVEVIERPNGGISVVLADGSLNNTSNKSISTMISHRVIGNISEGVRDGAAIRAASSRIFAEHSGSIQSNLNVISADMLSNTILISRNSPVPVFIISEGHVDCLSAESEPIGANATVMPSIVELPIHPGLTVIAFSDGVFNAGRETEQEIDICTTIESLMDEQEPTAKELADFLLHQAIRRDNNRPQDDMSVVVIMVSPQSADKIRRMNVTMTL